MLHIKFQTSEHSGSGEETFECFMYFNGLNIGPLVRGHLGPRNLCLNKFGKGPLGMQCYIPNFKHLSKVVLKKRIFEYFAMYFYGSNLGESCGGTLLDLAAWILTILVKVHMAMLHIKFQVS